MGIKYKKILNIGKKIKIKIANNSGITITTKYKNDNIFINKRGIRVYGENGVIKKQKQLWIFKKKKINIRELKTSKFEKRIKVKNKRVVINQILNCDKDLMNGIKRYRISRISFWFFILLSVALNKNLIIVSISIVLSIYFSIRAFKFIKYKKIYSIIKKVGKELSFMNLYNQEKINLIISKFGVDYGEDIKEYKQLKNAFDNFKSIGKNIEKKLNNLEIEDISYYLKLKDMKKNNIDEQLVKDKKENNKMNIQLQVHKEFSKVNNRTINYRSSFENNPLNNLAILHRKEEESCEGIRSINRAIDFFEDIEEQDNNQNKDKAVISKDNSKLTVYFYKKASIF